LLGELSGAGVLRRRGGTDIMFGGFVLQFFIYSTSLVICWVVSITEDAPDSARSLFTWALACRMIACAFHAAWFEMAEILVVYYSMNLFNPISFTICTSTFSKLYINVYSGMWKSAK
jgi:hypothetical protein